MDCGEQGEAKCVDFKEAASALFIPSSLSRRCCY